MIVVDWVVFTKKRLMWLVVMMGVKIMVAAAQLEVARVEVDIIEINLEERAEGQELTRQIFLVLVLRKRVTI